jgi:hypothetical protein
VRTASIGTATEKFTSTAPTRSTPTGITTSRSNVFDPNTLPRLIVLFPSRADRTLTSVSGRLVAAAMIVIPARNSEIPNV